MPTPTSFRRLWTSSEAHLLPSKVAVKQEALGPQRIRPLDQRGIDVQVLSVNGFSMGFWWYAADRDLATRIVRTQDEYLATFCRSYPDRFVGLSSPSLQHPDLAVQQLDYAVKQLGLKGAAIGGHVDGARLSEPRFHPFWAKVQELGVVVFMHPNGSENALRPGFFEGSRGGLTNIIGNPLETTIALTHLILEGTLDRFPGLRICAAHAGGYLPVVLGPDECGLRTGQRQLRQHEGAERVLQATNPGRHDGVFRRRPAASRR